MNNYVVRVRVAFETQRIQGSERDWLVASGSSRGRRWITFTRSDSFITPVAAIRVPFIDPATIRVFAVPSSRLPFVLLFGYCCRYPNRGRSIRLAVASRPPFSRRLSRGYSLVKNRVKATVEVDEIKGGGNVEDAAR